MGLLRGTVHAEPEIRVSKAGNQYASLYVHDGKLVSRVLLFGASVGRAKKLLQVGDEILCDGEFNREDQTTFKAIGFSCPGKEAEEQKYRSTRKTVERWQNFISEQEKKGFVKVYIDGKHAFRKRVDCVRVNGTWTPGIEFVMDFWGGAKVEACLKEMNVYVSLKDGQKTKEAIRLIVETCIYDFIEKGSGNVERGWAKAQDGKSEGGC